MSLHTKKLLICTLHTGRNVTASSLHVTVRHTALRLHFTLYCMDQTSQNPPCATFITTDYYITAEYGFHCHPYVVLQTVLLYPNFDNASGKIKCDVSVSRSLTRMCNEGIGKWFSISRSPECGYHMLTAILMFNTATFVV